VLFVNSRQVSIATQAAKRLPHQECAVHRNLISIFSGSNLSRASVSIVLQPVDRLPVERLDPQDPRHHGTTAWLPALVRLEQRGWIRTEWGVSETNREVKFYSLTEAGAKQLKMEIENWRKANALVARFLEASA
jgi:hypothetical protein